MSTLDILHTCNSVNSFDLRKVVKSLCGNFCHQKWYYMTLICPILHGLFLLVEVIYCIWQNMFTLYNIEKKLTSFTLFLLKICILIHLKDLLSEYDTFLSTENSNQKKKDVWNN